MTFPHLFPEKRAEIHQFFAWKIEKEAAEELAKLQGEEQIDDIDHWESDEGYEGYWSLNGQNSEDSSQAVCRPLRIFSASIEDFYALKTVLS